MVEPDIDHTWQVERNRLRKLLAAGIALTSELALDDVLEQLLRAAAELTQARYAAIGVLDKSGTTLERFITHGIDEPTRALIGDYPRGRGILGALIKDARPLRLSNLGEDPRAVGVPPGHPPMKSFLGVPVMLRGVAYGNLYLTEKAGGEDFTEEDEEVTVLLASQAAVAIDNARLYETATNWMHQLESLGDVSKELAGELDARKIAERVCTHLCRLVQAETALVSLITPEGELRLAGIVGPAADGFRNAKVSLSQSKVGRVLERGRAERIDQTVDDPEIDQRLARQLSLRSALMVPMRTGGRTLGLLMVFNRLGEDGRFSDADLRLAELFAERAAQAIDISRRVSRDALERAVAAQEAERRRLGGEIHDDAGQMLAAILMGVRQAAKATTDSERQVAHAHVIELVEATVESVRRLSHQLRPRTLELEGLDVALSALGRQIPHGGIDIDVAAHLGQRINPDAEVALFRLTQEGLTNIVRHSEASRASVTLTLHDGTALLVIEDDGNGFDATNPAPSHGLGLANMHERLDLVGGTLEVISRPGHGTTLRARVPV